MAGNFVERINHLQQEVGHGDLTMKLTVHQPYAAAEHNRTYYKHPRGGIAGYVEIPFQTKQREMLQKLADGAVTPDGSHIKAAAIDAVAMFETMVDEFAPILTGELRDSCNLDVLDNGATIFHKEQEAPFRYDKD